MVKRYEQKYFYTPFPRVGEGPGKGAEGRLKWDDHDSLFYPEYFIKDHLGNVRVVLTTNPNQHHLSQITDYYPFGMEIPVSGNSDNQLKYNGKELQMEAKLEWYDYGARFYDPSIGRWHSVDPQAERYSSLSPYTYVDNNPILLIDLNGEEISFSYEYEKDKDGNYVVNENGGYNLTGVTMHITGKVMNVSDGDVDLDAAVAGITKQLEASFQGEVGGVSFKTEANLTVAKSMDDVAESDHIFALADIGKYNGKTVTGGANDFGGKVAFVDAAYFKGPWDKNVGNTGERTAGHEFGHLANLRHSGNYFNIMRQGAGNSWFSMSTSVTSEQLKKIHTSYTQGKLNQGSNSEMTPYYNYSKGGWEYKKMPNRGLVRSLVNYKGSAP